MKRVMFFVVSAFLAVTAFAVNTSKVTFAKVTGKSTITTSQTDQPLILEPASDYTMGLADHYSHSSHSSHGSHGSHSSHSSHSSHYSSRFA